MGSTSPTYWAAILRVKNPLPGTPPVEYAEPSESRPDHRLNPPASFRTTEKPATTWAPDHAFAEQSLVHLDRACIQSTYWTVAWSAIDTNETRLMAEVQAQFELLTALES